MNPLPAHRGSASPALAFGCGILLSACSLCMAAADTVDVSKLPPPAQGQMDYTRDIKPILEASCLRCHGPAKPKSGFRLDNRANALKGGEHGADILPGNSAKSPLLHNVAGLVEDMQMPPPGKGDRLTSAQIATLRAWIDQGAAWSTNAPTNNFVFSISPTFGGTVVSGNTQKFRELNGQLEGLNGGLDQFEMSGNSSPDTKYSFSGHVLLDDYKLKLSLDRNDLGFIHAGWDEFRKYYSDTGGLFPSISSSAPSLGRDLFLDIGKAWIDFGLTLPHWPQMKLGYEYDYKQGSESTTDWGLFASGNPRAIAPAVKNLNEEVHVIKFDLDHEAGGVTIEERFRGEFYHLKTQYSGTDAYLVALRENASERNGYFQGANTIRLEKKFKDWFFGSAGYLYSKLDSDATFMDSANNNPLLLDRAPRITLEKESHVFNLNGLLGPLQGLTLSAGAQAQWTRQHGFGGDNGFLNPVYTNGLAAPAAIFPGVPTILSSDYDQSSVTENVALRYSKIPYTALFAEARLQQQSIGQYDYDLQPASGFMQNTSFSSQLSDFRAGFNTSPWSSLALSAHYRRHEDDSHYDNDPGLPPPAGYPGFIKARNLLTDEVEAKLTWHPRSWLKTAFTYKYLTTRSWTDTDASSGYSPGGGLVAGEYDSQIYSINSTMIPCRRLFLSTTFSYQPSTAITADNNVPAVAVYQGETYSVLANTTYVLSPNADVFATYSFSDANYAQHNFAAGLPVGIEYQQQALQAGLMRRFGKRLTAQLKYGFYSYNEPASAGANNYVAHSIFGALTFKWP
jgi:mono/diheme cytochrome c family protein